VHHVAHLPRGFYSYSSSHTKKNTSPIKELLPLFLTKYYCLIKKNGTLQSSRCRNVTTDPRGFVRGSFGICGAPFGNHCSRENKRKWIVLKISGTRHCMYWCTGPVGDKFTRSHNTDDYNLHLSSETLKSVARTDLVISIYEGELLFLFIVFIRKLYRVEQLSITAYRPTLLRLCDSDVLHLGH